MDELPMQSLGTLDDLLDRAAKGVRAGTALDAIKDELTEMRDKKYRDLLNESDVSKAEMIRQEMKAIEKLAKALLVKEMQGDVAYQLLMQNAGGQAPPEETPLKAARVARRRPRRARVTTAK